MRYQLAKITILLITIVLPNCSWAQPHPPQNVNYINAEHFFAKGNFKEAEAEYKKASTQLTGEARALARVMQATMQVLEKKAEQAYTIIEVLEDDLDNGNIQWGRGSKNRWKLCLSLYHISYREYDIALPLLHQIQDSESNLVELWTEKTLAEYYYEHNINTKANTHYEKALAALTMGTYSRENYKLWAQFELRLGILDDRLQDIEKAIVHFKHILDNKKLWLKDIPEKEGELYLRLGKAYFSFMDYEVATLYLEEALQHNLSTDERTDVQLMLAVIQTNQKTYKTALKTNGKALADWKTRVDIAPTKKYNGLLSFGLLYQKLDDKQHTYIDIYRATLKNIQQNSFEIDKALIALGLERIRHLTKPTLSDNYNLALMSFERANILIKKLDLPAQKPAQIEVLMAKGALLFKAKQYKRAKGFYVKALDLMKGFYEEKHPLVSEASRALGQIYAEEEAFGPALQFIDKAVTASLKGGMELKEGQLPSYKDAAFPMELLYALGVKASILGKAKGENASEQDLLEALHAYESCMKIINELRKTFKNDGAKYQLASLVYKFSQDALQLCDALYQQTKDPLYLDKGFGFLEMGRSSILFNSLRDLKAKKNAAISQEILLKEQNFKDKIAYLNAQIYYETRKGKSKDFDKLIEWKEKKNNLTNSYEQLLQKIEKEYPKYYKLKYDFSLPKINDIQAVLKDGELILEYAVQDKQIYCFGISKDQVVLVKNEQLNEKTLREQIYQLLMAVEAQESFVVEAHYLYRGLLAKVLDQLKAEKLIIIPEAELNYLPFDILLTKATNKMQVDMEYKGLSFLLKKYSISYSYAARILQDNRENSRLQRFEKAFIGFAPSFDTSNTTQVQHWEPLPFAEEEVNLISHLLRGDAYTSTHATESTLKKESSQYAIIHLATHGVLNHINPLFSQLILEKGNGEDGRLHVYELYNTSLNTELIALSACNSGIGNLKKGEGAISLSRGFAYAGCENIVMSLWEVSDYSTKEIMVDFYTNLQQGDDKDVALQKAKLYFLQKHKDKITHPHFWAGLSIVGTPDPVYAIKEGFKLRWYEIITIILGLAAFLGLTIWWVRVSKK